MMPAMPARFCHRGAPPAVVSPGAVSRFGLAPVHGDRHEFDLRFVGARDDFVRALQHCTTRGHTPRLLATSPREARPKGRITLSPRAHRLATVEGDGERRAHEIQPCAAPRGRGHLLEARRPGDIESRALPRRKGSSPGSTMSRAPRGHRPRLRRVWRNARRIGIDRGPSHAWLAPMHGGVTRPGTRAAKRRAPREKPRCLRYVRMERVSWIAPRGPAATGLRFRRRLLLKELGMRGEPTPFLPFDHHRP
jgi:hypothetical protein